MLRWTLKDDVIWIEYLDIIQDCMWYSVWYKCQCCRISFQDDLVISDLANVNMNYALHITFPLPPCNLLRHICTRMVLSITNWYLIKKETLFQKILNWNRMFLNNKNINSFGMQLPIKPMNFFVKNPLPFMIGVDSSIWQKAKSLKHA